MAKVCNAATALHINQYNSIASIVHTHNNWHTKHDLHLHHMSVTLSTTMSFILSASMSVINHYVRHRVAGVYKCHIMMRSHTMLNFFLVLGRKFGAPKTPRATQPPLPQKGSSREGLVSNSAFIAECRF